MDQLQYPCSCGGINGLHQPWCAIFITATASPTSGISYPQQQALDWTNQYQQNTDMRSLLILIHETFMGRVYMPYNALAEMIEKLLNIGH